MSVLPTVARRSVASISSNTATWGPSFPTLPSARQGPCTWRKTRRLLTSLHFRFQHSRYQNLVMLVGGVICLSLFVVTVNWLFSSLSGFENDRRPPLPSVDFFDTVDGAPLINRHSASGDDQRPIKSVGPSRSRSKRLSSSAEPPEAIRSLSDKPLAGRADAEAETGEDEAETAGAEKHSGAMDNVPPPQHGHRVAAVREAFLHAWRGYRAFAFGHDEISPTTNGTNDSWGAFGVTLVDALDTMYIMGLFDDDGEGNDDDNDDDITDKHSKANEFYREVKAHVQSIDWARRDYDASFFETSIRYLGGLLSIHQLTGEQLFLSKAVELGDRLLPAFSSLTGIPFSIVNLQTGSARNPAWNGGNSILSELGSVQLEFKQLSTLSGNAVYGSASQKVMDHLAAMPTNGLFPVYINPASGAGASDLVSFGGLGDSFYEYLLKQYVLSGGQDKQALRLYVSAVDAMKSSLIAVSVDGRKYLGEMKGGRLTGGFDHLVCYVPGMLALGTLFIEDRHSDLELAIDLLETCIGLYKDQPTGLGPERVEFNTDPQRKEAYTIKSSRYLLRPETVESLFVLYRITGNMRYQDIGWEIFQAIERHCKTPAAYSGLRDVTSVGSPLDNSMQSFFLAETLKYLFLLFSDPSVLPLDKYVFTTEAHPFRVNENLTDRL